MAGNSDVFDHLFIGTERWDTSFDFYREKLGWKVITRWGENKSRGAILEITGMRLVLAEEHDAQDQSWSDNAKSQRPVMHIRVDNVDKRYTDLTDAIEILIAPEDTHWGVRWMVVKDPNDNQIAFYQDKAKA